MTPRLLAVVPLLLASSADAAPPTPDEPTALEGIRSICPALLSTASRSSVAQLVQLDGRGSLGDVGLAGGEVVGRWLGDGATGHNEAAIGVGLASALGISPGDEIVALWTTADGALSNDLFRVVGVVSPAGEGGDDALFVGLPYETGCLEGSEGGQKALDTRPDPTPADFPGMEVTGLCEALIGTPTRQQAATVVEVGGDAGLGLRTGSAEVALGHAFAGRLGLEAGDRALLTYASADGEIGTRLFRVGALLDRDVQALFVADGPEPICPRSVPVPRPPAAVP